MSDCGNTYSEIGKQSILEEGFHLITGLLIWHHYPKHSFKKLHNARNNWVKNGAFPCSDAIVNVPVSGCPLLFDKK